MREMVLKNTKNSREFQGFSRELNESEKNMIFWHCVHSNIPIKDIIELTIESMSLCKDSINILRDKIRISLSNISLNFRNDENYERFLNLNLNIAYKVPFHYSRIDKYEQDAVSRYIIKMFFNELEYLDVKKR